MIALHAAFDEDQLIVWVEPESGKAALLNAVAQAVTEFKFPKRALQQAAAWLPSQGGQPLPSSPLLNGTPALKGTSILQRFVVTALPLSVQQAVDLLGSMYGQTDPLTRCSGGRRSRILDSRCAVRCGVGNARSVSARLENGIPRVCGAMDAGFAGPDASRLTALAKAMPPSARALTSAGATQAPEAAAESVLASFVGMVVDWLVRSSNISTKPVAVESIHDRWLCQLVTEDGVIKATSAESKVLAGQIEQWQRAIRVSMRAPFRLSFRLEEPREDEETWRVGYLLQGTKDPSLMLPAADVWNPKQATLATVVKDSAAVREHLLISLGQAAGICPNVEASLKERAPQGYSTDAVGAYAFLRKTAAALEMSGFGVMLPAWWTRKGAAARLTTRARVKSGKADGGSGLSLETLVHFDWELALGEEKISKAELAALARLKTPLVKLRGQWVEVNPEQIKAALDYLKKNPSGQASVRDIVQMAIGAVDTAGPLEVNGVAADGWVGDVLAQLEGRTPFEELPQPSAMNGTLRPYQLRGYSWLGFLKNLGLGACLADDMGLGKTVQTLALIQRERAAGESRPVLLVCPTSVVGNWQKESARFAPQLPVLVHHGGGRTRGSGFSEAAAHYAIVLSTYALLHRDLEMLREVEWAGVILDEAQNIKNAGTKQSQAARALKSGYRITLTGTPVENNVGDLWSLMEFINPGFLGPYGLFKKRFFVPIQVYSDKNAAERLKSITGPFILRRLKTDKSIITDLPDKLEMKVFCNLTKEQASLYEAVVKDMQAAIEKAEGIERKGLVLATLMKLKQVCNHPAQFLKDGSAIDARSGKLARLAEMLEETLAVNDRSLIFSQFKEMGDIIQRHLQETFGVEVLFLHGGTTKKQRDSMVERFQPWKTVRGCSCCRSRREVQD